MDITRFWVADAEVIIRTMDINLVFQFLVEREYVVEEPIFKLLHIFLVSFTVKKLPPGKK